MKRDMKVGMERVVCLDEGSGTLPTWPEDRVNRSVEIKLDAFQLYLWSGVSHGGIWAEIAGMSEENEVTRPLKRVAETTFQSTEFLLCSLCLLLFFPTRPSHHARQRMDILSRGCAGILRCKG